MNRFKLTTYLLFSLISINVSSQNILKLDKNRIFKGDTVTITYPAIYNNSLIIIKDPLGDLAYLEPEKNGREYLVNFNKTRKIGFLNSDWNKYTVYLSRADKKIDSANFYLDISEKLLYFTIYIDDIGAAGYLNSTAYNWYKNKGGKFNYGFQIDDFGGDNLKNVLKHYNDREEFIFHHFHAHKYNGSRLFVFLNKYLKMTHIKPWFNSLFNTDLSDRLLLFLFGLLTTFFLIIYFFIKKRAIRITNIFLAVIFSYMVLGIFVGHNLSNPLNREIKLDDPIWCMAFLKNIKNEFVQNNMSYPEITRHGWTIPPKGLNEFYTKEMGVLADASLGYSPWTDSSYYKNDFGLVLNNVLEHRLTWPDKIKEPIPFYTNINNEINSVWDGLEENRGVISIPCTHGAYAAESYGEKHFKIIDDLPNGALVSCWGHPAQNVENVGIIIDYIEQHYKIKYVNIKEYLQLFMKSNPRPVSIDFNNNKASWIYLGKKEIDKIADCELVSVEGEKLIFNFEHAPEYVATINDKVKERVIKGYQYFKDIGNYKVYKKVQ